jgi:hypothetical protein
MLHFSQGACKICVTLLNTYLGFKCEQMDKNIYLGTKCETMDKVQVLSNSECYKPSSELLKIRKMYITYCKIILCQNSVAWGSCLICRDILEGANSCRAHKLLIRKIKIFK